MHRMPLWSCLLCFSQNPPSSFKPRSIQGPARHPVQGQPFDAWVPRSDSSALLVGQLLSSESSSRQPGVTPATQPVDPTQGLSFHYLNSIPVHFRDANVFKSLLLKFKYGRERLRPRVVRTFAVQCWQEALWRNDWGKSGRNDPGGWEGRRPT